MAPVIFGGINIHTHNHANATAIFGVALLPGDGDPLFECVAKHFTEYSKEDISEHKHRFENPFWWAFNDLAQTMNDMQNGLTIMGETDRIASSFIRATQDEYLHRGVRCSSTPFQCHLGTLKLSGKLTGVTTYFRTPDECLPFTIFVGMKGLDPPLCAAEEVIPYLLLQTILKYERNPTLQTYSGFAVSMKGSTLQFNKGAVSRGYLEDLICGKVPSDPLTFLRSDPYDLFEQEDQKECARGWIGLMRNIHAELDLYDKKEPE